MYDRRRSALAGLVALSLVIGTWQPAAAQGPDVIVGDLQEVVSYGSVSGVAAYAVGTTSCNIGDQLLQWQPDTPAHPVIGQQLYRIKDGRFDQIGLSWLKHGFCALSQSLCGPCIPTDCETLGIGCSDPYTAPRNGAQSTLGPRSQVNPFTGVFPYPFSAPAADPVIGRRLQVPVSDVDPALNPGATYFVEGHYVTQDDAAADNRDNNVSHRPVAVAADPGTHTLSLLGSTVQQQPAIYGWQAAVPGVVVAELRVPGEGLFLIGSRAVDNTNGTWLYEYCVYNMNSDVAARSFSIALPAGIDLDEVEFHAPAYHSGEPFSNEPWNVQQTAAAIEWTCDSFSENPNTNAIRWSRMYSFRFIAQVAPQQGPATIGLFKTGGSISTNVLVPSSDFIPSLQDLTCDVDAGGVSLTWTNPIVYDQILVSRGGEPIATIQGGATTFQDTAAPFGQAVYKLRGFVSSESSSLASCVVDIPSPLVITHSPPPAMLSGSGTTLTFEVTPINGGVYAPGSAQLVYVYPQSGQIAATLTPLSATEFEAFIPPLPCGVPVIYWISAETTAGEIITAPTNAPDFATFSAVVADDELELVDDNMETDQGWTVGAPTDTATSGIWERVNPFGTSSQPENDHSPAGTVCWVTGQGSIGGSAGENDVDGGATTLISPVYDLSQSVSPTLGYWRWFHNGLGVTTSTDTLRVEISANGTDWVEIETVGPVGPDTEGGWIANELLVSDYVPLTETVQVRFVATDEQPGSIVEAAIDDLTIRDLVCTYDELPFIRGDCNDDGGFDIGDALHLLDALFGSSTLVCNAACDVNDDAGINLADAVYVLAGLFAGESNPPSPHAQCGWDPTGDSLTCDEFESCP